MEQSDDEHATKLLGLRPNPQSTQSLQCPSMPSGMDDDLLSIDSKIIDNLTLSDENIDEGLLLPDNFEIDDQLIEAEFRLFSFKQLRAKNESASVSECLPGPSGLPAIGSGPNFDEIADVILENTSRDHKFSTGASTQPQQQIKQDLMNDGEEYLHFATSHTARKNQNHSPENQSNVNLNISLDAAAADHLKSERELKLETFPDIKEELVCSGPVSHLYKQVYGKSGLHTASTSGVSNESSSVSNVDSWLDDLILGEKTNKFNSVQNEADEVNDFDEYETVSFCGNSKLALSLQKVAYPVRNKGETKVCSLSGSVVKRVSKVGGAP